MSREAVESAGHVVSRRTVLRGAAVAGLAGVGAAALAGCGSSDDASTPAAGGGARGGGSAAGATATAKAVDVPVGGGTIVKAGTKNVVITQPTAGEFKAYNAACTHQGCPVNRVAQNLIFCPCHASAFKAEDGSPTVNPATGTPGPAQTPLAPAKVAVDGENISVTF